LRRFPCASDVFARTFARRFPGFLVAVLWEHISERVSQVECCRVLGLRLLTKDLLCPAKELLGASGLLERG